jgi:hypothetical protein
VFGGGFWRDQHAGAVCDDNIFPAHSEHTALRKTIVSRLLCLRRPLRFACARLPPPARLTAARSGVAAVGGRRLVALCGVLCVECVECGGAPQKRG